MRWLAGFARGRTDRSAERDGGNYEGKAENDAHGGPFGVGLSNRDGSGNAGSGSDDRQDDPGHGENEDGAFRGHEVEVFGWQALQCSHSLYVSGFAAIMLAIADLVEPARFAAVRVAERIAMMFRVRRPDAPPPCPLCLGLGRGAAAWGRSGEGPLSWTVWS